MTERSDLDKAGRLDAEFWLEQLGERPPQPEWTETSLRVWVRWVNWILDHGCQSVSAAEGGSTEADFEDAQKYFIERKDEEENWLIEIDQLRIKYPRFASRLHVIESSRARGRPRKGIPSSSNDPDKTAAFHEADIHAQLAAQDIEHIRALYRQYFGKNNRPINLPPGPAEVAAACWGVSAEMVREKKRRGGLKPRNK